MKLKLAVLVAVAFVATTAILPLPAPGAQQPTSTVTVTIDNYAFKAPTLTIAAGTTVAFKNLDDDPHTVTAVDATFDSKGLAQGDTWTHRFDKPGTYAYYCKVHPFMKGTIIVKEAGS